MSLFGKKKQKQQEAPVLTEPEEEINLNEFKEDYAAALEKCQGDFLQTVGLLAEKYPFVNSKSEILEAQNYVKANTYFLKEEEQ